MAGYLREAVLDYKCVLVSFAGMCVIVVRGSSKEHWLVQAQKPVPSVPLAAGSSSPWHRDRECAFLAMSLTAHRLMLSQPWALERYGLYS